MRIAKLIALSFLLFCSFLSASNSDDEIINNLEFFQSMELLKDDNPYINPEPLKDKEQNPLNETKEVKK